MRRRGDDDDVCVVTATGKPKRWPRSVGVYVLMVAVVLCGVGATWRSKTGDVACWWARRRRCVEVETRRRCLRMRFATGSAGGRATCGSTTGGSALGSPTGGGGVGVRRAAVPRMRLVLVCFCFCRPEENSAHRAPSKMTRKLLPILTLASFAHACGALCGAASHPQKNHA